MLTRLEYLTAHYRMTSLWNYKYIKIYFIGCNSFKDSTLQLVDFGVQGYLFSKLDMEKFEIKNHSPLESFYNIITFPKLQNKTILWIFNKLWV